MWREQQLCAQEQYKSLLTGLKAVSQVKGWKVHQQKIVFVVGTCGSIHVDDQLNHSTAT
jgi:hypothetical protein